MANWKLKLDVKDVWAKAHHGEIQPNELASEISKKLKSLQSTLSLMKDVEDIQEELNGIIEAFDEEAKDESMTMGAFDSLWNEVYDWADTTLPPFDAWPHNKLCWVQTF